MSLALETKVKELRERIEILEQQEKDKEVRLKALEDKYHMLNARMSRGKPD